MKEVSLGGWNLESILGREFGGSSNPCCESASYSCPCGLYGLLSLGFSFRTTGL